MIINAIAAMVKGHGRSDSASRAPGAVSFGEVLATLEKASGTETEKAVSAQGAKIEKLKALCAELESLLFARLMADDGSQTIKGSIPEGPGHEYFKSMLNEKRAENAAGRSGMGLADLLFRQLVKRLQSFGM
jgi:Rod binding domain-containing protein